MNCGQMRYRTPHNLLPRTSVRAHSRRTYNLTYSDFYTAQAIQATRYEAASSPPRHAVRHWLGKAFGTPLIRAGARLLDDPIALRSASGHLAVRAIEEEHQYGRAA